MMESGDHGLGNAPARLLNGAANRGILSEREMRAGLIPVAGVGGHDALSRCPAKHNHMIYALASFRESLCS